MTRGWVATLVARPVTIVMVTLAVLVFGAVGATKLPVELLPNLSYPTLTVQTELPDAAPSEVEELLTRPIEERLRAVPGVIHLESTSKEGLSEIVLDLAWGTRIDTAMAEVREKLDRVVLPTTAVRPLVLRYDPSQEPIVRLALAPTGTAQHPDPGGDGIGDAQHPVPDGSRIGDARDRAPDGIGDDQHRAPGGGDIGDAQHPAPDGRGIGDVQHPTSDGRSIGDAHDLPLSAVDLATLRHFADITVKRSLEKIPGVAAVRLYGGEEREIAVEVDPDQLAARGVTAEEIVTAIQRDNVNEPGGALTDRQNRYLIRTVHEARTPADIGAVIVRSDGQAHLRVRDVARVRLVPREPEVLSLVETRDAVELAIYREGDSNIVAVAEAVRTAMNELRLPRGLALTVLSDRAIFVESAIAEVRDNALTGGLLAIVILLFFLRDLRATAVIALAIPISLLASLLPLQALGVSFNVMSLGGLALGVGMLVDNSIVVLEAIDRVARSDAAHGRPRREIVVEGTSEVASSVVASTLTTIAVFLPMRFVEGIAGQMVTDLSYAVSLSITSSMLVSLTLVPVLQSIAPLAAPAPAPARRSWFVLAVTWPVFVLVGALGWFIQHLGRLLGWATRPLTRSYDALERAYPRVLRVALRWRGLVLGLALASCLLVAPGLLRSGQTLVPELDQSEFFVLVELPREASLERTRAALVAMSAALANEPEVAARFVRVGSWTVSQSGSGETLGPYLGQLDIRLAPDVPDRGATIDRIMRTVAAANPEPAAVLQQRQPALLEVSPAIEILVLSEDRLAAADHTRTLVTALSTIDGLVDIVPDPLEGRPEVQVDFDPLKLAYLGLTLEQAARAVQRAIQGEVATTLFVGDERIDVRVRLPLADRSRIDDVRGIPIATVNEISIALRSIADVERRIGAAEIHRINGRRGFRIHARSTSLDLGGIARAVEGVLAQHPPPLPNVDAVLSGQAEQVESSLRSLMLTAALSVFLVYVVMAASFESLWHPFIILLTVPLGLSGVALACLVTGTPASAMVGIGVIVLGGIVVNNAIVLIHAIADGRREGLPLDDALVRAGSNRVRPILMTTATTVLGLLPMALGFGDAAALRQPLAVTIIGGLSLSTLLTLLVIPCIYRVAPGRVDAGGPR